MNSKANDIQGYASFILRYPLVLLGLLWLLAIFGRLYQEYPDQIGIRPSLSSRSTRPISLPFDDTDTTSSARHNGLAFVDYPSLMDIQSQFFVKIISGETFSPQFRSAALTTSTLIGSIKSQYPKVPHLEDLVAAVNKIDLRFQAWEKQVDSTFQLWVLSSIHVPS